MTSFIRPSAKDAKVASAMKAALAEGKASEVKLVVGDQEVQLTPRIVEIMATSIPLIESRTMFGIAAEDKLLTTQEAADLLGYSRPTLIKQLEKFQIPISKVGKHRKITFENLDKLRMAIRVDKLKFLHEMADLEQKLGIDE
jgi:excisionase family DNA binding protein